MAFLLDHLPAAAAPGDRRAAPIRALPLARLRARGELVEVRAADLRFTPDEAAAYLTEVMGLPLTAQDVRRWRGAPRDGSPRSSWRRSRCRAATTSPASSPASPETTATSSTTWSRRCCSVSPSRSRPSCCRPPILDRLSGPLCDAVTGQDGGEGHAGGARPGEPVPRAARRPPPVVPLPPPLRRRAATRACWTSSPTGCPTCTGGRARGTSRTASGPWPSITPWPPRTSSGRRTWSSWRCRRCVGTDRRRRCAAGSRRSPTSSSALRPVLSNGYVGALLSTGEVEGVEPRLRDAERWLEAMSTADRTRDRPPDMVVVDEDGVSPAARLDRRPPRRTGAGARRHAPATVTHARRALDLLQDDDHLGHGAAAALIGLASWASGDLEAAHDGIRRLHGQHAAGRAHLRRARLRDHPGGHPDRPGPPRRRRCAPTSRRCSSHASRTGRCCGERRTCTSG